MAGKPLFAAALGKSNCRLRAILEEFTNVFLEYGIPPLDQVVANISGLMVGCVLFNHKLSSSTESNGDNSRGRIELLRAGHKVTVHAEQEVKGVKIRNVITYHPAS